MSPARPATGSRRPSRGCSGTRTTTSGSIEIARRSRAIWSEWEERFGVELISRDGGLALGDSALERLDLLEQAGGLAVRAVGADEVADRLPLLAGYSGPATFDQAAGAIRTRAAIRRAQR